MPPFILFGHPDELSRRYVSNKIYPTVQKNNVKCFVLITNIKLSKKRNIFM